LEGIPGLFFYLLGEKNVLVNLPANGFCASVFPQAKVPESVPNQAFQY
jgi:hypothetical protein